MTLAMERWPEVRIGNLGEVFTGRTPSTQRPSYFGNDFPFITPGDMRQGKYARETDRCLSQEGADLLKRIQLPARSVCVSCIGWQMGEVIMTDRLSFTNQQINSIVPNGRVVPSFLYYSLRPRKQELLSLGAATGVRTPILNKSAFCDLTVRLPPLPIQQRIAGILSAYDDLIENSHRRIRILETMARALYREWFVYFRFPGHETRPRVTSPLGEIPQGWEATSLGNLVEINRGKNITKKTIRPGDVPVVAGGVTPAYFHDRPNTKRPVITVSASGANAGFVNLYHVDVWASDCSYIDSSVTSHVYYYYLWLDHRRSEVTHLQRGSAQPHVYPKDLARLEAIRVPEDVLDVFAMKATPIFELMMRLGKV